MPPFYFGTLTTAFQFHKGTIRTNFFVNQKVYTLQFQFHKGTIRTLIGNGERGQFAISIP